MMDPEVRAAIADLKRSVETVTKENTALKQELAAVKQDLSDCHVTGDGHSGMGPKNMIFNLPSQMPLIGPTGATGAKGDKGDDSTVAGPQGPAGADGHDGIGSGTVVLNYLDCDGVCQSLEVVIP